MPKKAKPTKPQHPRKKSFFKRAFYTVFLLFVLVGAGYYAGLQYLKSDSAKTQIVKQLEKATGRDVEVGSFDLELSLQPTVKINGLLIKNAEWGKAPHFLKAKEVLVTADLLPMLSKEFILKKINLVNPDVNLEKNKDGIGNWSFNKPEGKGDKKPDEKVAKQTAISLNSVKMEQAVLNYLDMATGAKHALRLKSFELTEGLTSLDLNLDGTYQKKPLALSVTTGTVQELIQAVKDLPIKGSFNFDQNTVNLDGKFTLPKEGQNLAYNTSVIADIKNVPSDLVKIPAKYKSLLPLKINVAAQGTDKQASLKNLKLNGNGVSADANGMKLGFKPTTAVGDLTAKLANAGLFVPQLDGKSLNFKTNINLNDKKLRITNLTANSEGIDVSSKTMSVNLSPLAADGDLKANIENLGLFAEAVEGKALKLDTQLKYQNDKLSTQNMTASIGRNTVNGAFGANLKAKPIALTFNLKADDIYTADFMNKKAVKEEGAEQPKQKPKSGKLFSDKPLDLSALNKVNLNGSANIQRLHLAGQAEGKDLYRNVDLKASISNGAAAINSFSVNLPGGARIAGSGGIDGKGTPSARANFVVDNMILGDFLKHWTGNTLVNQGKTVTRIQLTSTGKSIDALAANSNGSAEVIVRDASVKSGLINLIADDLVQNLIPFMRQASGLTKMNCIVTRWPIKNGVAETDVTLIDTQQITIAGKGSVNLRNETINMRLIPSPKKASLVSLSAPIKINGNLSKPKIRPDTGKVATDVLKAAALGAINPLAIAVPFLTSGTGDADPCTNVLDGMQINLKQPAKKPANDNKSVQEPEEAIKQSLQDLQNGNVEDSLKKAVPELLKQDPKESLKNLEETGKKSLDGIKGLFNAQ